MVERAVPQLSEPRLERAPFQTRLPIAQIGRQATSIVQGVIDIKAGRNLREFESEVSAIEQGRVEFNTELSAISSGLSTSEGATAQEFSDRLLKLDTGVSQGKLSRSAAQTRLRALFSEFSADHPTLAGKFQEVIGLSSLGALGVGGGGGTRSSTGLEDDPFIAAARERNEEIARIMLNTGLGKKAASDALQTAATQEMAKAQAVNAANEGTHNLPSLNVAANTLGNFASIRLLDEQSAAIKDGSFNVADATISLESARLGVQTELADLILKNQENGGATLTTPQFNLLVNRANASLDMMQLVINAKDPVAANKKLLGDIQTRGMLGVLNTVTSLLGEGPLRDEVISMSPVDLSTLLHANVPEAARIMAKSLDLFEQTIQANPELALAGAVVQAVGGPEAYTNKMALLRQGEIAAKPPATTVENITSDDVRDKLTSGVLSSVILTSIWSGDDLSPIQRDAGIAIFESKFTDTQRTLLHPRAIENIKKHPDYQKVLESRRQVGLQRNAQEASKLLRTLPPSVTVRVNTSATSQPVRASSPAVRGRTQTFREAPVLEIVDNRKKVIPVGKTSERATGTREMVQLQKMLDKLNVSFAFNSRFVSSSEYLKEIGAVIGNIEKASDVGLLPPPDLPDLELEEQAAKILKAQEPLARVAERGI